VHRHGWQRRCTVERQERCRAAIASVFSLQKVTDDVSRLPDAVTRREPIDIIRQEMVTVGESTAMCHVFQQGGGL
jgi:hypothetical protein